MNGGVDDVYICYIVVRYLGTVIIGTGTRRNTTS